MKYLTLLLPLLLCAAISYSQDIIWQEDFGSGCDQGQLAASTTLNSGQWSLSSTGTNESLANTWFISAMENGEGEGNCGNSCGNNRTLHIGNVEVNFLILVPADGGATYYSSGLEGFCDLLGCSATNRRIESPTVDCSSKEDITLSFEYIEGGNAVDNATLMNNDGNGWVLLEDLAKTPCCGGPCNGTNQGVWTGHSIDLPESANDNPNVQIGFNWTNNDDLDATDPSIAIDNISFSGFDISIDPGDGDECLGDFNQDGIINAADLLILLTAPTGECPEPCIFDLDGSGGYETSDLLFFLSVFGTFCE
ncbi:MAG: hypothetical protein HRT74_05420 [Flavobacteriales bacterium]|nr:hypothetical protein [Flavobacteriales bacterium]